MGSGLWWQLRCKIYIFGGAATFISNSLFLIRVELSPAIKGQYAPGANPEPRIPNPEPRSLKAGMSSQGLGIEDWKLEVTSDW